MGISKLKMLKELIKIVNSVAVISYRFPKLSLFTERSQTG